MGALQPATLKPGPHPPAARPDFLERLGALVRTGQVELLGGGLYEPILASLPERDRIDQLCRMADTLERITGAPPRGAWLAERVWEPDLPTSLVAGAVVAGWRVYTGLPS